MNMITLVIGLIASVTTILASLVLFARFLGRKFDKWTETVIENSIAIRSLSTRITQLEEVVSKK